MINNDEYIGRIVRKCTEIMYKYPNLFPLSDTIIEHSKVYKQKDRESITKYLLLRYSGLQFIVRTKCLAMTHFEFFIEPKKLDEIMNLVTISVLSEYNELFITIEDHDQWDKMLKKENLT